MVRRSRETGRSRPRREATYLKVREPDQGRHVDVAVVIAIAVNGDGRRQVLGMDISASEAETFWVEFLRTLRRRGLAGVKLAAMMDDAETDVLASMTFPKEHSTKLHATNPIERLNAEITRRTRVVGVFPNEDAITRLVGAILLEQNDEWAVQRARTMTPETIMAAVSDDTVTPLLSAAQ